LVPWLAIAFGCGILLYFSIDQEPAPWAVILLFTGAAAVSVSVRLRPIGFPLALFIAAVAFGFASATIKRTLIAHPVLWTPAWNVDVTGFVEVREERERSDRLTVRVERMEASRLDEKPRPGFRPQGHDAGCRRVRRIQSTTFSSARAVAPRRL